MKMEEIADQPDCWEIIWRELPETWQSILVSTNSAAISARQNVVIILPRAWQIIYYVTNALGKSASRRF